MLGLGILQFSCPFVWTCWKFCLGGDLPGGRAQAVLLRGLRPQGRRQGEHHEPVRPQGAKEAHDDDDDYDDDDDDEKATDDEDDDNEFPDGQVKGRKGASNGNGLASHGPSIPAQH